MKAVILSALLLLASCGPAHKLRKAERLMNQAIAQGAKVKIDTVTIEKIVPGEKVEVRVPVDRIVHHDTTIVQDRVKIHFQTVRDTVRVSVDCPPDTIRVPVTIHKSIICPDCPRDRFWKGFGWGACAVLALAVVYGFVRLVRP